MLDEFTAALGEIAADGGWVFWSLIGLAFGIGFSLLSIRHSLKSPDAPHLTSTQWRQLLTKPTSDRDLLNLLRRQIKESQRESQLMEIEQRIFSVMKRRITFAFILIGTAPLVGLLGTVTGMSSTFNGMARNSSTTQTDVIAEGISEALITTQTGLVICVPSFIICSILWVKYRQMRDSFLTIEASLKTNN
ncbi:MAG: MotA/TolQ/ExbB proton channel family protein [Verrucomicrobiaceae bacterium]|nr:MotA/TolQ/ExbB proton channel family protein [Verrucomicrobiaceae bacterium]